MSDDRAAISLAHDRLIEALTFYALPGTYHAIAFMPDPPAGEFAEDFDENHGDNFYQRAMPGSRARAALNAWWELVTPADDAEVTA